MYDRGTTDPYDPDVEHDERFPGAIAAIRSRRSGRNFDAERSLDDEEIEDLLCDARFAPSSYNLQPWEFVVVRDDDRLDELVDIADDQSFVRDAGTAILVVGHTAAETAPREFERRVDAGLLDPDHAATLTERAVESYEGDRIGRDYGIRNASLAAATLLLSAHARGLTACPMIGFDTERMCSFLDVPDDKIPVLLVAVGPSGGSEPARPPRRPLDSVVHRESFERR